jgi:single-stranded DNA-binding protein
MGDVATIQVFGNLTKAAEPKPIEKNPDRLRVRFTVASSFYRRGQQERPKAFYGVTLWMNRTRWDTVSQFLQQGSRVFVWGELRPNTGNDGRLYLEIEEGGFTPAGPAVNGAPMGMVQAPQQPASQGRYVDDGKYPGYVLDTQDNKYVPKPQGAAPPAPAPPQAPPQPPPPGPPEGAMAPLSAPPPSAPPPPGTAPAGPNQL